MAYVVTQSCCADASCVVACPVNCIHPAPGEPGFATAEMLYVDPATCVGCGACVTACPVGAIVPDTALTPAQEPFRALNADYFEAFPHRDRAPVALVPEQRRLRRPGPFRVAVVGSGPAGLHTADELLRHPEVTRVDVYERLDRPHGLARYGVAPDHGATRRVSRLLEAIEREPGFRYVLGVEVGTDVFLEELRERYDAVVYAVGASADRGLGIPGEHLRGSVAATDLVGWYNDHPDRRGLDVPLDAGSNPSGRAVVVGAGNVALDVARILTRPTDSLEGSDIAPAALARLRDSAVREVVVLGRRGPAQAAFTVPELIGLAGLEDVDVVVEADPELLCGNDPRSRLLSGLAGREVSPGSGRRRLVLRFGHSPAALTGTDRVTGVDVVRNRLVTTPDGTVRAERTAAASHLEAGLVVRAVGHRGLPVPGLPYDEATGTVPHREGRVEPGLYVVGWVKRGPVGFIGTNKACARETVAGLLDDLDAGPAVSAASRPSAALAGLGSTGT